MRENGVGPSRTESPGGESERIRGQQSTTLQRWRRAGVRIAALSGPSKSRRSQVNMEASHRRGRLQSSGELNAEEHVQRNIHRENGKIQE